MLDITDPLMFVFFACALFGGSLLLMQFALMCIGFGGGDFGDSGGDVGGDVGDIGDIGDDSGGTHPAHHGVGHADATGIFKMLSLRTIVAGLTFFGLGGLGGMTGNLGHALSLLLAVACGSVAFYIVYYIYLSIARLNSDGSISAKTLVGSLGNVYLRIPATGAGAGKVLVNQQERTMEYEAITAGEELKAGTPIIVVRIVSPTTVEVKAC